MIWRIDSGKAQNLGTFDSPNRQELAPLSHSYVSKRPKWWGICDPRDVSSVSRRGILCDALIKILLKIFPLAAMDNDLDHMTRAELIAEIKKLRNGIRQHRDTSSHDLCWHHPDLWGLLPEKTDPLPVVPERSKFLEGCIQYRRSLITHLKQLIPA